MLTDNKPYNVLIIEDNPGDFVLIEDFLMEKNKFLKIIHVKTFEAAKKILNLKKDIDVVLLDLSLPDKTGEALIIETVALCKTMPVIVLTGFTDLTFGAKSLSLGISDYILKDDLTAITLYKSIVYSIERKRSISVLEQSEKKYSELFHLSPLPMLVYDSDTLQFLNVNKSAIKSYGYSREEFLSMTVLDITLAAEIDHEDEATIAARYKNQLKSNEICSHKTKSGKIIKVEVQSSTINHESRRARIILSIDVTEKLNYIEAIEHQNEKLREISWIQSHVVRAPLARVMGLISLLKDSPDTVESSDLLYYLEMSANELDNTIKDITNIVAVSKEFVCTKTEPAYHT